MKKINSKEIFIDNQFYLIKYLGIRVYLVEKNIQYLMNLKNQEKILN